MRFTLLTRTCALLCAGDSGGSFTKDVDNFIQDTMQTWHLPGLAVAVIDGNDTYYQVRSATASPII